MWTENEYTTLVSSHNSARAKFMSFLDAVLGHLLEMHGVVSGMSESFSIDNAVGDQLDVLGEWAGVPRVLSVSIAAPIYIEGEPYYTNEMTDDEYRAAIRLRVAKNYWNGSNQEAAELYKQVFGDEMQIEQTDNMDGTVHIAVYGSVNTRMAEIMNAGGLMLVPAGIGKTIEVIENDVAITSYSTGFVKSVAGDTRVQMINTAASLSVEDVEDMTAGDAQKMNARMLQQ